MFKFPQKHCMQIFALLVILLFATSALPTQGTSKRIRFPRGRRTAVLRDSIEVGINQHIFTAKAGQTLKVCITSSRNAAKFDVYSRYSGGAPLNSGAEEYITDWEGILPEAGDYTIWVYSDDGSNTRYTLTITLGKAVSSLQAQHNNGMHPTAKSAALIENLCGFEVECAAGDAGR